MSYRDLPPTQCLDCQHTEMSRVERLIEQLRQVATSRTTADIIKGSLGYIRVLAGPEPSWYQRHRTEFELTGSVIELERMLRHQTEIGAIAA